MASLLIKGNVKMGPNVYLYNLPPGKTCTPTDWCLHGRGGKSACYGFRNNFRLPSVIKAAERRLRLSKQDDFVDRMVAEIRKKNPRYFRFHSSGDFYSKEYARKVMEIAKGCPETLFRTTTRRRDLTDVLQELNSLPNFIVRESLDNERPKPEMGLPFAALRSLPVASDAYLCVDDCPECRYYCWENSDSITFEEF